MLRLKAAGWVCSFGLALGFGCSSSGSGDAPRSGDRTESSEGRSTFETEPDGTVVEVLDDGTRIPVTGSGQGTVQVLPDGGAAEILPDGAVIPIPPTGTGVGADDGATLDGGTATGGGGGLDNWDANASTDACVDLSIGAEGSPVMLQFVIDKSTSMNREAGSTNGASKWTRTVEALVGAFPQMDPSLAVGVYFYPTTAYNDREPPGCAEDTGGVPVAPLDAAHVAALQAAAQAIENPTNPAGTPTHDAWRVGLARLQAALVSPPAGFEGARGYLVLMTDGMPTHTIECGDSYGVRNDTGQAGVDSAEWQDLLNDVAGTTAAAQIRTFVVGVPGSEEVGDVPVIGGAKDYVPRDMLSQMAIA